MQDTSMTPTIELWRMAAADPKNETLQQAVRVREADYRHRRAENYREHLQAVEKRQWMQDYDSRKY